MVGRTSCDIYASGYQPPHYFESVSNTPALHFRRPPSATPSLLYKTRLCFVLERINAVDCGPGRAAIGNIYNRYLDVITFTPTLSDTPWTPCDCARNFPKSLKMRCLTSSAASSKSDRKISRDIGIERVRSALHTDTPGRVDKASVLQALQANGESYDRVRETLKHVSVDASGKVELEDWVEVCDRARLDRG